MAVNAQALQGAIYQKLISAGHPLLSEESVFDAAPPGSGATLYVLIGTERMLNASDKTGTAMRHDVDLVVRFSEPSFAQAKALASDIEDILTDGSLSLSRGTLSHFNLRTLRSDRAKAGSLRQITMVFRALVDNS